MTFATVADRDAIENEMTWAERSAPVTTFGLLSQSARKFSDRPALSYQILSDPASKNETLYWGGFASRTVRTA